jgi:hypothetical protein
MKRIALLCLALVLALGALGVGYSGWYDDVIILADVETGALILGFEEGSLYPVRDTNVPPPDQYPANWDWETAIGIGPFRQLDKNVGWITWELKDEKGVHLLAKLYDTAEVTLHEVYPGYSTEITVWICNGGTIPFVIDQILLNGQNIYSGDHIVLDYMELEWGNALGEQLEPCDCREVSFRLRILQPGDYAGVPGAQQGQTYTFVIEIHAIQWNEA